MSKLKNFFSKHSETFSVRFFVFLGVIILCVVLLVTCRERDEDPGIQDPPGSPGAAEPGTVPDNPGRPGNPEIGLSDDIVTEENISEFITLGQYKGISFDKIIVDDQEVERFISRHMAERGAPLIEVTDRAVREGDIAVFDYEGSVDGVVFDAAQDVDLEIGSGMFIPGFEEQLIGHNIGDSFEINVTFPEVYHSAELAGQDAVFKIDLTSIGVRELTDDFVLELGWDLYTVAEYKEYIKTALEDRARNEDWQNILFDLVINSTFHKLPASEIEHHVSLSVMQLQFQAMSFGVGLEEFIFYYTNGMSVEDFVDLEIRPEAELNVRKDLVVRAIAFQENINLTQAEFDEGVLEIVQEIGYDSVEQFMEIYTAVNVLIALITERVADLVLDNAIPN